MSQPPTKKEQGLEADAGQSGLSRRPPRPGRRALIGLFAVFLAALALQAAERAHRERQARHSELGYGAEWIWAPEAAELGAPVAFFAVRDFKLDHRRRAWVNLTVDEGYVLWVNGQRVGSGIYREGRPADLYDISDFLKIGWNRMMVEAVSSRGAGGILASLRLDEPNRPIWGSDGDWRIFERSEPWLIGGTRALGPEDGSRPVIWQLPPTGRWRPAKDLALSQGFERLVPPLFPRRLRHPAAPPSASWRQLDIGEPLPVLQSQVVFDFSMPVTGHLEMGLDEVQGPSLLFFDLSEPRSPSGRSADGLLIVVPGQREWHDPQARRFRYLTIVGVAPAGWLRVRKTAAAERPPDLTRGVFGLEAPSPYQRVEEAVWRRLTEP